MGNYHIHVFILIPDILVDIFNVQGGRVFRIFRGAFILTSTKGPGIFNQASNPKPLNPKP